MLATAATTGLEPACCWSALYEDQAELASARKGVANAVDVSGSQLLEDGIKELSFRRIGTARGRGGLEYPPREGMEA